MVYKMVQTFLTHQTASKRVKRLSIVDFLKLDNYLVIFWIIGYKSERIALILPRWQNQLTSNQAPLDELISILWLFVISARGSIKVE